MPENRRSTTRYAVNLAATVEIGDAQLERRITNLSLGGAFIDHDERLAIGTRIDVQFRLPNREQPIAIGGEVRWVAEGGFGVQFDGLRAGEVWSLNQLFETLSESD